MTGSPSYVAAMTEDTSTHPSIYPVLRYDDARAAIRFLTEAFGFTVEAVHDGPDGSVGHAELSWGPGIVMLSSSSAGDPIFSSEASVIYVAVDDPDAHHDRAVTAGAEIVSPLTDQDYGSRDYAARDP